APQMLTHFPYTPLFRSVARLGELGTQRNARRHDALGRDTACDDRRAERLGRDVVDVGLRVEPLTVDGVVAEDDRVGRRRDATPADRKSTRLNSSHVANS